MIKSDRFQIPILNKLDFKFLENGYNIHDFDIKDNRLTLICRKKNMSSLYIIEVSVNKICTKVNYYFRLENVNFFYINKKGVNDKLYENECIKILNIMYGVFSVNKKLLDKLIATIISDLSRGLVQWKWQKLLSKIESRETNNDFDLFDLINNKMPGIDYLELINHKKDSVFSMIASDSKKKYFIKINFCEANEVKRHEQISIFYTEALNESGLNIPILYEYFFIFNLSTNGNILIRFFDYINDNNRVDFLNQKNINEIISQLIALHKIKNNNFDQLKNFTPKSIISNKRYMKSFDYVERNLDKYSPYCFCHFDLNDSNFLDTSKGIYLIDFDGMTYAPVYAEIAKFIIDLLDNKDILGGRFFIIKYFIKTYFIRQNHIKHNKVLIYHLCIIILYKKFEKDNKNLMKKIKILNEIF